MPYDLESVMPKLKDLQKIEKKALEQYEQALKVLNDPVKTGDQKPAKAGGEAWSKTMAASAELHKAQSNVLLEQYGSKFEALDKQLAPLREAEQQMNAAINKNNQEYKDGKIDYEQTITKNNQLREEFDQKRSGYKELLGKRLELERQRESALDEINNNYNKKSNELMKHPMAPPQPQPSPQVVAVKSDKINPILDDFSKKFKDDSWVKAHPPQEKDGRLALSFKTNQDMIDFNRDQAAKNRNFMVLDGATNKVMAYSQNGKFYHANGKEVKDGDQFTPSDKTLDQFKIPSPSQKAAEPLATKSVSEQLSESQSTGNAKNAQAELGGKKVEVDKELLKDDKVKSALDNYHHQKSMCEKASKDFVLSPSKMEHFASTVRKAESALITLNNAQVKAISEKYDPKIAKAKELHKELEAQHQGLLSKLQQKELTSEQFHKEDQKMFSRITDQLNYISQLEKERSQMMQHQKLHTMQEKADIDRMDSFLLSRSNEDNKLLQLGHDLTENEKELFKYRDGGELSGKDFDSELMRKTFEDEKKSYEDLLKNANLNDMQKKHSIIMIKRIEDNLGLLTVLENTKHLSPQIAAQKEQCKEMKATDDAIHEKFSKLHSSNMPPETRNDTLAALKKDLDQQEQAINKSMDEVQKMKADLNEQAKSLGVSINLGHPEEKSSFRKGASSAERELAIKMIDVNNLEQELSGLKQNLDAAKEKHAEQEKNAWTPEKEDALRKDYMAFNKVDQIKDPKIVQMLEHGFDSMAENWKVSGIKPWDAEQAKAQSVVTLTPMENTIVPEVTLSDKAFTAPVPTPQGKVTDANDENQHTAHI